MDILTEIFNLKTSTSTSTFQLFEAYAILALSYGAALAVTLLKYTKLPTIAEKATFLVVFSAFSSLLFPIFLPITLLSFSTISNSVKEQFK